MRGLHWGLALFVAVACLAMLGSRGLNEPDEGRYAEMSREMLANGDWLVPTLHGFAHFQKPPVIYWFTSFCLRFLGTNEWAARLPSALAAAGTAWLTFGIGRRLFGAKGGIAATVILVTSIEFFALARMLTPDMLMTFCISAAIAGLVAWDGDPKRRGWLWLYFAMMGAGFLTKGPMAIVVPASAGIAWQRARKTQGNPVTIPWLRGLILTLALGLSWFVMVSIREPRLFHFYLHDELFARVASKQHGRYHSPLFFVPVLLIGMLPWTMLAPALFRFLVEVRRTQGRLAPAWWLLFGWFAVPLGLLSLSGSKLITYALPLFPAMALALGGWWEHSGSKQHQPRQALAIGAVLLCGVFALLLGPRLVPWTHPASVLGLGAVVTALGAALIRCSPRPETVGWSLSAATLCLWLTTLNCATLCNYALGTGASVRSLVAHLPRYNSTVFAYGVNAPGLEFYLGRLVFISRGQTDNFLPPTDAQRQRLISSAAECAKLALPGQPLYGLIKANMAGRDFSMQDWRIVDRAGAFALIQRIESYGRRTCPPISSIHPHSIRRQP